MFDVDGRRCCFSPGTLVQLGKMKQTAPDRDDSPEGTFLSAVCLVCVRHRRLLLNGFFFVKRLERVGCELSRSIIANELDLLAKWSLDLDDVVLDAVFSLRPGPQTETVHAATGFVHDHQQISAAADRDFFLRGRRCRSSEAQTCRNSVCHGCLETVFGPSSLVGIHDKRLIHSTWMAPLYL